MSWFEDFRTYIRYANGLRGFLGRPLSAADAAALIARERAERDQSLARLLEAGVYGQPASPYRRLLEHYGIEYGDVAAMIADDGADTALERLHDAGVYLKLDEFKGRVPLTRPGLELEVSERDFDNPLLTTHFEGRSGGSRSAGRRTAVDLDHVEAEAAHSALFEAAFGAGPLAAWYPAPPSVAGLMTMLAGLKAGWQVERWFTQTDPRGAASTWRDHLLTGTTRVGARLWAPSPVPPPQHAPIDRADAVIEWLAERVASGRPGRLVTYPSAAVAACATALDRGADIAGSVFILSGEPYTGQKAAVVERAGGRGVSWYGATEAGSLGMPCAEPIPADDVHVMTHKVAIVSRPTDVGGVSVDGLFVTTFRPTAPKLMLNVEIGDYGRVEQRECGCSIGAAGLTTHLHSIRSYEKLTTQGMTFLGEELLVLLQGFLPERYGGTPEDYQLVEEQESDGVSHVTLVVSPHVGELAESELIAAVLDQLARAGRAQRMMAETWRSTGALRISRRNPHLTPGGKVLPLHLSTGASVGAAR